MSRKTLPILGAIAASLALAACSSGAEPVEAPETADPVAEAPESTPTVEEPESATLDVPWMAETYDGALIEIEWDVDPAHEEVAALEAFRVANGADPVTYVLVDLDNRAGTGYTNVYPTQIFDAEGEGLELIDGPDLAAAWAPETIWADDLESYHSVNAAGEEIPDEAAVELNEQWTELDLSSGAEAAERTTIVLAGPEDFPTEAAAVLVGDASAYPAEG